MDTFVRLPVEDQLRLCNEAQARLGLSAVSIEKDFWVCWTLRELFRSPGCGEHLTFKGGTSLSKGWKLIERFSEDIDIVIDRGVLGFAGDLGPEHAPSRKQQTKRLDALKAACQEHIRSSILPALRAQIRDLVPDETRWKLELDETDPDGQSLLFFYPTAISSASYVQPVVKIEMGARSDTEPAEAPEIQSYLTETFSEVLGSGKFPVRAVAPRRTFWEKAMLLHEETYRPEGKPRKPRLARHYYDLWCLIRKGVAEEAASDPGLFERVAAHRAIFFRWSWLDYATLACGSLRLVPPAEQINEWRRDYRAMQMDMFFGEVPSFDDILAVVAEFQAHFNENAS